MTATTSDTAVVRAVVVIRTAPAGFTAPYALAAVAGEAGMSLRRIDAPIEACPAPGDAVTLVGSELARPLR